MTDIASLVKEHQQIKAHLEVQDKLYSEYKKPYNEKLEQIQAQITTLMTAQGLKSLKTDDGTAILSEIMSLKIKPDERTEYIDWCLEQWDAFGGEMLQISSPKVDAVRAYMDANEGRLPPHIESSTMLRFSIRKV